MQFRKSTPPPYLNKSDQFRMLRMMGLLILVVIGMNLAANPKMWSWFFPEEAQNQAGKDQPTEKDIDYGIKFDEESPLPHDVFRSQLEQHRPAMAEASPARAARFGKEQIEIDPEILAPVSDGWLGIRKHEASAFYAIIAKAQELPLKLLEEAGDPGVDYTVLMTDSEQYRGRPLTVEGTIRLIEQVSASGERVAKAQGVDHYYVAWMWTDTSGNNPYRLIATSLPDDMPLGERLEVPAKFTGYFFKKEGYETEQGFHVAPVLIGKHIRWNRPPVVASDPGNRDMIPYVIGFVALIALGLGLMLWQFKVSDKKFGHKHIEHFITADEKSLEELANLKTHDPSEHLRQLESEAAASEKADS